ncbi:cobyrinate a,c-diamide synthase [Pseudaminobacter sp. 19-2017]|uniref:Hydrogenobyrinate a,c-diamide synthase n=1 Tax=Pseudaminobacter soli (ex Zhang et al. 2022) TaxID=2831468 RepID=A0A942E6B6_9HYPH|nr:cobyrinate a,c-diamide synthase [Pseudaminobacter soli]MBS3649257.1 cobyrinate a,c-diamide synthase [Pseudaminobacter soli]
MTGRTLIIGAPRSGGGKTSVTIGLLRALKRRGLAVRGAKSGPDYIDPAFHEAATGLPGVNLDSWAMPPDLIDGLLMEQASASELVIVESAMGLFDGIPAEKGRSGSAADLARLYGIPVLLVLDVSGQSTTAAAVAKGFQTYDPDVRIAGVVLNRVGSDRHRRLAGDAIEMLGLPILGSIARDPAVTLPERHLGLVQASEHADLEAFIDRLADVMERSLDLDAIVNMAGQITRGTAPASPLPASPTALPPPGQRIALAKDEAFTFLYPHHLAAWRAAGAEIRPFSPLADQAPDADCDVCWLPGGYPELHAGRLAACERFREGMRRFAAEKPVHGECGGFMVLGEALEDADGVTHAMLGLLGHSTSFAKRRMNLGYRQAKLLVDCPIGPAGSFVRGHEFHYARVTEAGDDAPLAELFDGQGAALGNFGGRRGHVTGTFFHAIAMAE